MIEKPKNWLYLVLMMTSLWGTGIKYEISFPLETKKLKISCKNINYNRSYDKKCVGGMAGEKGGRGVGGGGGVEEKRIVFSSTHQHRVNIIMLPCRMVSIYIYIYIYIHIQEDWN